MLRQAVYLSFGTASALGFARFAYGLLLPVMRDDLGWSSAAAGLPATANGLGYLLGASATPLLVRRLGPARAFRGGMVLTAVALAATGTGATAPVLWTVLLCVLGSIAAATQSLPRSIPDGGGHS